MGAPQLHQASAQRRVQARGVRPITLAIQHPKIGAGHLLHEAEAALSGRACQTLGSPTAETAALSAALMRLPGGARSTCGRRARAQAFLRVNPALSQFTGL
jgi:hypothetical protein